MLGGPQPLISTRAVAERVGFSENTVRWWRHIGYGPPSFKVGRLVRYRPEDVEAWIDAQASAA